MENLRNWGMNAIRLGVLWQAVEPAPGVYNYTYLAEMVKIVRQLNDYGIATLVDAHQDSLNPQFCGEGIPDHYIVRNTSLPDWLKFPFPIPVHLAPGATGPDGIVYPNITDCQQIIFGAYMFSYEEDVAWRALYSDPVVVNGFVNFWRVVATAFRGVPGVIGYELINEPWPADVYANPLEALFGFEADVRNLMPLYEKAYAAIREVDNDTLVFYEPAVTETTVRFPTGFKSGPGGPADNRTVYSYHMYCDNQNKTGDILNVPDCTLNLEEVWGLEQYNIAQVGGGHFLTEFGAVGPHESSAEVISFLADLADLTQESWTYWTFKGFHDITTQNSASESFYNADGSLQTLKVGALSRTYAQRIATSNTKEMFTQFNATTKAYSLSYVPAADVNLPTIVYFNSELHYPNGFTYSVVPAGALVVKQADPFHLYLYPATQGLSYFVVFSMEPK